MTRAHRRQQGAVLLIVLLLVVLFSGLGVMAMRHTQAELRSAGAYLDGTQAALVAEAGIAMTGTDIKLNWNETRDWPGGTEDWPPYKRQFELSAGTTDNELQLTFSPMFGGVVNTAGTLPDDEFRGTRALAATSLLATARATTQLVHEQPIIAPTEAGFSNSQDDNITYSWYYFTARNVATYGSPLANVNDIGRAEAQSRMVIGPLLSF